MGDPTPTRNTRELKALFLTIHKVTGPKFFNSLLYHHLISEGCVAHTASIKDRTVTIEFVCQYSCITFLSTSGYENEIEEFRAFIHHVLVPAKNIKPKLNFLNGLDVVLWNADKTYLRELRIAGFPIPKVDFFAPSMPTAHVKQAIAAFSPDASPVVLKPTVSVSSQNTHLIRDPSMYTEADNSFLASLKDIGPSRSMIIQEFVPDIKNGEYSLLLINGMLKYGWIKKPMAGEFRCQSSFGGDYSLVLPSQIPQDAVRVASALHTWLADRFRCDSLSYARVDGIVSESGKFALIEVELIEPALELQREKPEHLGISVICRELFSLS